MSMDAAPISIDDLLGQATEAGASDLHLVPGAPPTMRLPGDLTPLQDEVMPTTRAAFRLPFSPPSRSSSR